jgi:hypothetical protein
MREAISNAKICLSNNDFSNPLLKSVNLYKREKAIPEEEMEKDFMNLSPKESFPSKQKSQDHVQTLGDELNELYDNELDDLFNYDENSSNLNTPRGYTMFPSVLDTNNEPLKKFEDFDFGVYEDKHDNVRKNLSPFEVNNQNTPSQNESNKSIPKLGSPKIQKVIIEEIKEESDNPNQSKTAVDNLTPTPSKPKDALSQKKASSAGNTPLREAPKKKKDKIPKTLKEKMRSLSKGGSVMAKYSLDKFKEKPERANSNSVERLKNNLEKFQKNKIFKIGSESEMSIRSRDSQLSSQC